GIDIGQPGEDGHTQHAGVAEPLAGRFYQQQDHGQQGGEAQCRAELERVLQRWLDPFLQFAAGNAVEDQRAGGVDQASQAQWQQQLRQQGGVDHADFQQHAWKHQSGGGQQSTGQQGAQLASIVQARQSDGHGGGGHHAAEQGGDQQAVAGADHANGHVGGK